MVQIFLPIALKVELGYIQPVRNAGRTWDLDKAVDVEWMWLHSEHKYVKAEVTLFI